MTNALYYGDNLDVLRNEIASDSIDLIYLDPPFNSQANYNVLFRSPSGKAADAQIEAFEDTWHWGEQAERAFSEVLASPATQAAELLRAMRSFLGENDMMAYLAMMAVRLIELHRVLKPIGSLYLHCDPIASHYLKLVLDAIFGKEHFLNEIIWNEQALTILPKGLARSMTRFSSMLSPTDTRGIALFSLYLKKRLMLGTITSSRRRGDGLTVRTSRRLALDQVLRGWLGAGFHHRQKDGIGPYLGSSESKTRTR